MYTALAITYAFCKDHVSSAIMIHNTTIFPGPTFKQTHSLNTLRPRQNDRRFADVFFKRIFLNGDIWMSMNISLKFVPKGQINNIPALIQIMAWRRPGDKPLSEPMMLILLMHICVTRPQWVNRITYSLGCDFIAGTYVLVSFVNAKHKVGVTRLRD